jgi:hypothetical protein
LFAKWRAVSMHVAGEGPKCSDVEKARHPEPFARHVRDQFSTRL